MAKKNADKIDPSAGPRAPRRTQKRASAPAPVANGAAGVTTPEQRAEAADMAAPAATSDTPAETAASGPSYDDNARAAYERYLSRGGDHGRDFEDWLEAEKNLRKR